MSESTDVARGGVGIENRRDARALQRDLQLELYRRIGVDAVATALNVAVEHTPARTERRIPAIVVRKGRAA